LYCLPVLNINIRMFSCNKNPINEIVKMDNIDIINKQIKILNKFRELYYSLKFKKQFRDLLWVKIREPKIREKYSYKYLENLHEDTDLDEFLDNWIKEPMVP
jgi:hypothetical protein